MRAVGEAGVGGGGAGESEVFWIEDADLRGAAGERGGELLPSLALASSSQDSAGSCWFLRRGAAAAALVLIERAERDFVRSFGLVACAILMVC